jgi:glycogen operon protein
MSGWRIVEGRPAPLGATVTPQGVNFAVFSAHASSIDICLFDAATGREVQRLTLPDREGDIHFGLVPDLPAGTLYGLRAEGPYAPEDGHRFNVHKLLVDPYAKALVGDLIWHPALMGYETGKDDLTFDSRDSAPYVPRARVIAPRADWPDRRPATRWSDTIIYEAHVKGLTMRLPGVTDPGSFRALGSAPVIEHLTRLGVTAVELLPIHAFITDAFLQEKGLTNYWGYQTLGFFAPHPPYLASGAVEEVQTAIAALHAAGIEVILDVVYNHSCEGDETGPTLSFRGLDNASYYLLDGHGHGHCRGYVNHTGTGNTLNLTHPAVLRMVMDSLRHWVETYHVDGFRFDLGATLGRGPAGFDARATFFQALGQDPVLARVKLIAEPWDIGPGGYQLGNFPAPFAEWNDRFRDTARRVWRGDLGQMPEMAARLTASADIFDHSGRRAWSSINFITAHDGFTLADLTTYSRRHNAPNGEDGQDGHAENYPDNMGEEGPTTDPARQAARALRRRNLLATLLLSQGVPMLLAGDEIGNSQSGNNNAYAMDNPTGWIDWAAADEGLLAFTADLIAARKTLHALRQDGFLHGTEGPDGQRDLVWHRPDGAEMTVDDWEAPALPTLIAQFRDPDLPGTAYVLVLHTEAGPLDLTLPPGRWLKALETTRPGAEPDLHEGRLPLTGPCVALFLHDDAAAPPQPPGGR